MDEVRQVGLLEPSPGAHSVKLKVASGTWTNGPCAEATSISGILRLFTAVVANGEMAQGVGLFLALNEHLPLPTAILCAQMYPHSC